MGEEGAAAVVKGHGGDITDSIYMIITVGGYRKVHLSVTLCQFRRIYLEQREFIHSFPSLEPLHLI